MPAGADWCSLCFADLRPPPPEPEPGVAVEEVPIQEVAVEESTQPVAAPLTVPEPPGEQDAPGPSPRVEAMLAELAAEESARTPGVLDRFSSRGMRVAVMIGGTVVLSLVLVLVIWVLGILL